MNKKVLFILPVLAMLLAGCNKAQDNSPIESEESTTSQSASTSSQTSSQESSSEDTSSEQTSSEETSSEEQSSEQASSEEASSEETSSEEQSSEQQSSEESSSEQSSSEESSSSEQITNTHRIHVPALFDNFYVWAGGDSMAAWPGTALAEEDATWKVAAFDAGSYVNIIFNGSSGQTVDLDIPAAGEWWMQVGTNKEAGKYAAQFVNSKPAETTYENVAQVRHYDITVQGDYDHFYCWQDQGAPVTAAWPGDALVEGHAIFDVALTGNFKIIFNGSGGQTSDLDLPAEGGAYTFNGTEFVAA